jgi:hypothetical protein
MMRAAQSLATSPRLAAVNSRSKRGNGRTWVNAIGRVMEFA